MLLHLHLAVGSPQSHTKRLFHRLGWIGFLQLQSWLCTELFVVDVPPLT